ncbi:MAG: hypothetical protein J07HQW2_01885 [Haloquadratum walsbyi J07HQW2]|jgi:hypothetical protein|uniref:Uncharacterized protein n=1 Tax=Haloquadratum walsbyi J07HQW2 TaxID=1238425 RepID=U1NF75_9EURY|nr:MAG: hypothetical protein J07HQW2_01885 [Haloquadratum walsbyi J07HQW2]
MVQTLQQNLNGLDADEYEVLQTSAISRKASTIKASTKCDNTISITASASTSTTLTTS